jgi:hypothetical protein
VRRLRDWKYARKARKGVWPTVEIYLTVSKKIVAKSRHPVEAGSKKVGKGGPGGLEELLMSK